MNNEYEELVHFAYCLVNNVGEKYVSTESPMVYLVLLSGVGNCKVANHLGEHNYQAMVDAIHLYYKEKGNKADQGFYEGLLKMVDITGRFSGLSLLIDTVLYQLKKEKEGTATFTIDADFIFDRIRNNIKENYNEYENNNKFFETWLIEKNKFTMDNYGFSVYSNN